MGTIRYIEHTADAGVEIGAASREELFVLGARALYQLVLDYDAVGGELERRLELAASNFPELFHAWLAELLYLLDAEGLVFKKFGLAFGRRDTKLAATLWGEEIDVERHRPHGEIKNVTYADFAVERERDGTYRARVIFDL
ncbi:MAG: archease [candidate division Zixibacteria bacterium]|nr:archease [candidate division Zixibacteria bacterium]